MNNFFIQDLVTPGSGCSDVVTTSMVVDGTTYDGSFFLSIDTCNPMYGSCNKGSMDTSGCSTAYVSSETFSETTVYKRVIPVRITHNDF